jgi:alpha-D-ribose 1-methylphosphonate 5-triphosphate diphosphatase PhnM
MPPKVIKIAKLMFALIVLEIGGVVAVGSIAGIEPLKAALLAAGTAILSVSAALALGFIKDGKLDNDEIQAIFTEIAKKKEKG